MASTALRENLYIPAPAQVTIFVCANAGRPGSAPTSAGRPSPVTPDFHWPFPVKEIVVPCTGRLQPEHLLKAFDAGATLVSVIGCREDNCHFSEGSRRCARRIDFIRQVLDEIGLGCDRLLFLHLPGTASEDMALSAKTKPAESDPAALNAEIAAIHDQVINALATLSCSPLSLASAIQKIHDYSEEETDISNDDNDE